MKIDIIIPVYNSATSAVNIVNELVKQNIFSDNIILIDDGSTDDSLEKIRMVERNNKNIKVISQANGGPAAARNSGLKNSTNDYVWFVDSDDMVKENSLELLHSVLNEKADVILFGCINEYINNGEILKKDIQLFSENVDSNNTESIIFDMIKKNIFNPPWNKVLSRDFLNKKKCLFKNIHLIEDVSFIIDVFLNQPKISILNQPLYIYKQEIDNMSSVSAKYYSDRIERGTELNSLYHKLINFYSIKNDELTEIVNSIMLADVYRGLNSELMTNGKEELRNKIDLLYNDKKYKEVIKKSKGETKNLKVFRFVYLYMMKFILYHYVCLVNYLKK